MRTRKIIFIIICVVLFAGNYLTAQDSSGVRFLGREYSFWIHTEPTLKFKSDIQGDYAYVAAHLSGLQIVDISDPENMHIVGYYDRNIDLTYNVQVVGDYAYLAASRSGLLIFDVSDPRNPRIISSYGDNVISVFVADGLAYVAHHRELIILDVHDPIHPVEVGVFETNTNINDIVVVNNIAYLACSNAFLIVDVSDPLNPEQVGYDRRNRYKEIALDGGFAYLMGPSCGIDIFDISIPAEPRYIEHYDPSMHYYDIAARDGLLYVVTLSTLHIVDISNPEEPARLGYYYRGQGFESIDLVGNMAYLIFSSGLYVLDVEDPELPDLLGSSDHRSSLRRMTVRDNYGYLVDPYDGLRIVDMSDPEAPIEVGRTEDVEGSRAVAVSGDYAYLVRPCRGFHIINISDPETPEYIRTFELENTGNGSISIDGEYAYLSGGYGMTIIEISDPADPEVAGVYEDDRGFGSAAVSGGYAYIAIYGNDDEVRGLSVMDVTDPGNLEEVYFFEMEYYPHYIRVANDILILSIDVSNEESHVILFDISNPAEPSIISEYNTSEIMNLSIDGDFIFISREREGLEIVDISDLENPVQAGYYDTPGRTQQVISSDTYVYVADLTNFSIYDCGEALGGEYAKPEIEASIDSLDFGEVVIGDTTDISLTISNEGDLNLCIDSISITGMCFRAVHDSVSLLEPGNNFDITIFFAPDSPEDFTGLLTIISNDPENDTLMVNLHGIGQELNTVSSQPNSLPDTFSLSPVYPNPFNSTATIKYGLPHPSHVSLSVYDLAGRLVETLVDERVDTGHYIKTWQAGSLPSGLYFVRFEASNRAQMQKVILIR